MSDYLYVKNWEELQHYKTRNPPWIKLYRRLMTDGKFHLLTEAEQWQLVRIWLVSAEEHPGGYVPNDEKWLRRMTQSLKRIPVERFVQQGWLQTVSLSQYTLIFASTDASNGASSSARKDPPKLPPRDTEIHKEPTNSLSIEDPGLGNLTRIGVGLHLTGGE